MLKIVVYNPRAIAEGAFSCMPGCSHLFRRGTRGTDSARYCYSVWMRHLIRTRQFRTGDIGKVVELGPGDSLGSGLASMLCGAEAYIAVDAVQHANAERDQRILVDLIALYKSRAPIPGRQELPEIHPCLPDYRFPMNTQLNLDIERINLLADALKERSSSNPLISLMRPEEARCTIPPKSVSLVFSQAVLEHVDDPESVYASCHRWLKSGGLMSHQIDFRSHGTSRVWNGHWVYPNVIWRLIRGNKRYLINRMTCSSHLSAMEKVGFTVISTERVRCCSRIERMHLARPLRDTPEDDLTTAGVYIVARKS